jgi:hypothetical protein
MQVVVGIHVVMVDAKEGAEAPPNDLGVGSFFPTTTFDPSFLLTITTRRGGSKNGSFRSDLGLGVAASMTKVLWGSCASRGVPAAIHHVLLGRSFLGFVGMESIVGHPPLALEI